MQARSASKRAPVPLAGASGFSLVSQRTPATIAGMSTISVQEIERDPLTFFRRVEAGEAFVVLRRERPFAEVRPVARAAAELRPFGLCAGQFTVPGDFDSPLPEDVLKDFEES